MNQLEDMRLLVSVLERNSFTAAADALGLSKQFVSRRLTALEARLGVRLLNRSTRKLSATPLGQVYYERAVRILEDVEETESLVSEQRSSPRGTLRLSAPMSFGTLHLSTLLPGFLLRYPEVSIELDLSDRMVDVLGEGYDMAVRIGVLADSTLIARPLVALETVTCCSPAYLALNGVPETPASLGEHECLLYGHSKAVDWDYWVDGRVERFAVSGRFRVNNGELVRDAAIAGLGLARLPTFIVGRALEAGDLVPVLQKYQLPSAKVFAVYPQHRQASLLIRTLIDYLKEVLA
ncbi:LysR family transcriptional regulator [Pseudomonas sp. R-28-1W-6]|uniref:LysR family transcriptional regulator n=1 Tax=Pseudomonas sp. R-28-1W-6 TaxID=2650101 RepID=UPI0013653463|nr:LysR family transcriptional regulator [Pseudomonas sp. R-28-1W-6]MWV11710.1 LysR family transcriptional regulator [Pseudomonas sp. R-28-1W-6]